MNLRVACLTSLVTTMAAAGWAATGTAHLAPTTKASKTQGHLTFTDTEKGLRVSGTIENAPPGKHGFHVHEFGACGDEGNDAGGHYNPAGHPHGSLMKDGVSKVHAGDMGNVEVKKDGTAKVDKTLPGLTLTSGEYPVAGRAVVLHEKADDFGQPTGNAGGRIACGPIVITAK